MKSDSFFTKGTSHKICEDYTMHGLFTDSVTGNVNPYAILCDGCSGSDETDFGSRLLARSAKESLKSLYSTKYFTHLLTVNDRILSLEDSIKQNVFSMIKATNSSVSTIDATLLMTFVFNDQVYVYMRGDGAYVYKEKDTGIIKICNVSFVSGAPYYLSYDLNTLNNIAYHNLKNEAKIITTVSVDSSGKVISEIFSREVAYDFIVCNVFRANTIEFIGVMSDGIGTLQYDGNYCGEKNATDIDIYNTIYNMVAYKTYAGTFVDRRMNKFMRDKQMNHITNFDDISSATICLD